MDLAAEWGLSFYIEADDRKILFDLGSSDLFLHHAISMGIDLFDLDYLVLSHGHYDHTWGMEHLLKQRLTKPRQVYKTLKLVTHPLTLQSKFRDDLSELGIITSVSLIHRNLEPVITSQPVHLTDKLIFLGEIERLFEFEGRPLGKVFNSQGELIEDQLLDDTALVYNTGEGLIIITGCSHSGICNIIQYARKVCQEDRIIDVIGGFHLLNLAPENKQLQETQAYFKQLQPKKLHPSHCTDLASKIALAAFCPVEEVRTGLVIDY